MWFRRDLRLGDNPALVAAAADGDVLPLFVLDPRLWGPAGPSRRAYLGASLRSLDASLRQRHASLSVVRGDPARRVVLAAKAVGAQRVHVAADYAPYGHQRDLAVEEALKDAGIELVRTGSPYAVAPGRVVNGSGDPYKVFTPFFRSWTDHGWRDPIEAPTGVSWCALEDGTTDIPDPDLPAGLTLPEAGEAAAGRRWQEFVDRIDDYDEDRDKPGVDGTSRLSVHLKYGEVHPRTLLADLSRKRSKGAATYRQEIAWREFYADVLFRRPDSARDYYRPEYAELPYDEPGDQLAAWQEGRTGFPIVDAGMRQLRATGWMHNRLRMIVASFLVKDLHLEWQHGARHFLHWLVDGDLASNNHGWQWTAGSGTDASPFFRVFNPTSQGRRFDPEGGYVRRWVDRARGPRAGPRPARAGPGDPGSGGLPGTDGGPSAGAPGGPGPMGDDPMTPTSTSLVLPARYNGPPRSGNGGYAAGALAATLAGRTGEHDQPWPPVTVTLRQPPPLDTVLEVSRGGEPGARWAEAYAGETLVARAEEDASAVLTPVSPVPVRPGARRAGGVPGLVSHPFPTCFACGTDREPGDGLRIFPGPVDDDAGRARVAATWTPDASLTEDWHECRTGTRCAALPVTWAALDCISAWSSGIDERPMVLGRMTTRVDRLPVIGEEHVVVGLALGTEGRKNVAAASLYDAAGGLVATAQHVWISVDPATF